MRSPMKYDFHQNHVGLILLFIGFFTFPLTSSASKSERPQPPIKLAAWSLNPLSAGDRYSSRELIQYFDNKPIAGQNLTLDQLKEMKNLRLMAVMRGIDTTGRALDNTIPHVDFVITDQEGGTHLIQKTKRRHALSTAKIPQDRKRRSSFHKKSHENQINLYLIVSPGDQATFATKGAGLGFEDLEFKGKGRYGAFVKMLAGGNNMKVSRIMKGSLVQLTSQNMSLFLPLLSA